MSLPNPSMNFTPYDPLPASDLNNLVENIESLADGTGFDAGAIGTADLADASVTNAKLATGAGEPGGAWDSWTPTLTNLTLGNGTVNAKYKKVGKTVHFKIVITLGSTSSVGSGPTVSLPETATGYNSENWIIGVGYLVDTGVGSNSGSAVLVASNTAFLITAALASGTYLQQAALSSTTPHTWGNGDKISLAGSYEAA